MIPATQARVTHANLDDPDRVDAYERGSGSAILQFTELQIATMLACAKDGEFDHLT